MKRTIGELTQEVHAMDMGEIETELFKYCFDEALIMNGNGWLSLRDLFLYLAEEMPHIVRTVLRRRKLPKLFTFFIRDSDVDRSIVGRKEGTTLPREKWCVLDLLCHGRSYCDRYDKDLESTYRVNLPIHRLKRDHLMLNSHSTVFDVVCDFDSSRCKRENLLRDKAREAMEEFVSILMNHRSDIYCDDAFHNRKKNTSGLVEDGFFTLPWRNLCEPVIHELLVFQRLQRMTEGSVAGSMVLDNLFELIFEYFRLPRWGTKKEDCWKSSAIHKLLPYHSFKDAVPVEK